MQLSPFFLSLILIFCLVACDTQQHPALEDSNKKELLIYSGMTMIQPLMEINIGLHDLGNVNSLGELHLVTRKLSYINTEVEMPE